MEINILERRKMEKLISMLDKTVGSLRGEYLCGTKIKQKPEHSVDFKNIYWEETFIFLCQMKMSFEIVVQSPRSMSVAA